MIFVRHPANHASARTRVRRPAVLGSALLSLALAVPASRAAQQAVALAPVVGGLVRVTSLANAGDARLFIGEKAGRIRIWDGSQLLATPFLDISAKVETDGDKGLMGFAFHPSYASNRFFYVFYIRASDGQTAIERYQTSSGDPDVAPDVSAKTLLATAESGDPKGGAMAFGPDGYLYVGVAHGDDTDPSCLAQKTDNWLGKILRLDVDQNVNAPPYYGVPADNPFVGPGDPLDEIWSKGFRNPWRLTFDRLTGDMWIGDVGVNREEIDLERGAALGGRNYGWKTEQGSVCNPDTSGCPVGTPPCGSNAYTRPVFEYDHSQGCAVTGGYLYRGTALPALVNAYVFSDFCSGAVWALDRGTDSIWQKLTLASGSFNFATLGEDASGELYVAEHEGSGGTLFRITQSCTGPDGDSDGVPDGCDNCPAVANSNQADGDRDGDGNACDNCPAALNPGQEDTDGDSVGNACDTSSCAGVVALRASGARWLAATPWAVALSAAAWLSQRRRRCAQSSGT